MRDTQVERRYALQTTHGKLVIEIPSPCTEKDLEEMRSFMNWAYRAAGGKPIKKTLLQRLGFKPLDRIDGSYYRRK